MSDEITLATSSTASYTPNAVIGGEAELITNAYPMAASTALSSYHVVALNTSDQLVEWVPGAGDSTAVAIGVLCHGVTTGSGENPTVPVYVGGYFNTDALVWPSGATATQKLNAFLGTNITHRALA